MPRMTEAEAWALEDEIVKNPPKVDPAKARHPVRMNPQPSSEATKVPLLIAVNDFSADWLRIKAEADHTTPGEIIDQLVRERIAVTV